MPRHKPPPKRAGRRASGHVFLLSVVRQNCAGFHASHDACEDNPTLGGGEQTLVIARLAFGLRKFRIGFSLALGARQHSASPVWPTQSG